MTVPARPTTSHIRARSGGAGAFAPSAAGRMAPPGRIIGGCDVLRKRLRVRRHAVPRGGAGTVGFGGARLVEPASLRTLEHSAPGSGEVLRTNSTRSFRVLKGIPTCALILHVSLWHRLSSPCAPSRVRRHRRPHRDRNKRRGIPIRCRFPLPRSCPGPLGLRPRVEPYPR